MNRDDLQFQDYVWTPLANNDPRSSGELDQIWLDRQHGFEVLAFLRRMSREGPHLSTQHGKLKVERMLRAAPPELSTRRAVGNWILANWLAFGP